VTIDLGKHFPGSWSRLSRNIDGIREFTESRPLMWMILAADRSRPAIDRVCDSPVKLAAVSFW
jgi:hypothetical protein